MRGCKLGNPSCKLSSGSFSVVSSFNFNGALKAKQRNLPIREPLASMPTAGAGIIGRLTLVGRDEESVLCAAVGSATLNEPLRITQGPHNRIGLWGWVLGFCREKGAACRFA